MNGVRSSWLYGLLVLLGAFSAGLLATSVILAFIGNGNRDAVLAGTVVQNLLAFAMPALALAWFASKRPMEYACISVAPHGNAMWWMLCIMAASMPALNWTIEWNASMHLPESLRDLETSLRAMEDAGADITAVLLGDTSIWGLLSGVLCVGVITGCCEEMFFRGGLQNLLTRSRMNPHLAVWLSAIIFSLLHFQFFGFVPRMLLGAMFGYFFLWSGSIWVSATAHALNNSLVVVLTWLHDRDVLAVNPDTIGVGDGFPWIPIASGIVTIMFFQLYRWSQNRKLSGKS